MRFLALAFFLSYAVSVDAQRPTPRSATRRVKLSAVLTTFLADSGIRTRGLPWTTGNDLPITWQSPGPVTNPDANAREKGLLLARIGQFTAAISDSVAIPVTITLAGPELGLASTTLLMDNLEVTRRKGGGFFLTRDMIEQSLRSDGLELRPIKCNRAREGASYGNLVDAVKAPGKTSSGLWWFWDSPQQRPLLSLGLLYRRTDMAQVECNAG